MPDPSMQPELEPDTRREAETEAPTAQVNWGTGGVTITMPDVGGSQPSSVTWDGSAATEDSANSRWSSSTTEATGNTLSGVYGTDTYASGSFNENTTRVALTKQ